MFINIYGNLLIHKNQCSFLKELLSNRICYLSIEKIIEYFGEGMMGYKFYINGYSFEELFQIYNDKSIITTPFRRQILQNKIPIFLENHCISRCADSRGGAIIIQIEQISLYINIRNFDITDIKLYDENDFTTLKSTDKTLKSTDKTSTSRRYETTSTEAKKAKFWLRVSFILFGVALLLQLINLF